MTTLAAIETDAFCVIACDSQSSDQNGSIQMLPNGKIFENGDFIIAGAGDVRGINILEHSWTAPKRGRLSTDKFVTSILIPSMRKAFIEAGYEINKEDSTVVHNNIFLVIVDGKCYRIDEDYSWERSVDGVYTAGSGEAYALGAITYALNNKKIRTESQVTSLLEDAIAIATKHDAFSGGVIHTWMKAAPIGGK